MPLPALGVLAPSRLAPVFFGLTLNRVSRRTHLPIVLDNFGPLSQGDSGSWPACAGGPIRRHRYLKVLDPRQVFDDVLAINSPHVDTVQKVSAVHVTAILSCPNLPRPRASSLVHLGFFILVSLVIQSVGRAVAGRFGRRSTTAMRLGCGTVTTSGQGLRSSLSAAR
jgi:hypothetical protein